MFNPANLFITLVYQPFFNLLLLIYWMLGQLGWVATTPQGVQPDMGVAVIILSVIIRVMLLPLSLSGHDSEEDRRRIAAELKVAEVEFSGDQEGFQRARKQIFHKDRRVVVGELISFSIQLMTALMLWRIFASGLEGRDLHLLYSFMPQITFPFNLTFLGYFDLSHSNWVLNLIQSLLIFALETISIIASPYPASRAEVVRLQLVLPVVSFLIFMGLPAGKKLFIITSLLFSIGLTLARAARRALKPVGETAPIVEDTAANPNSAHLPESGV